MNYLKNAALILFFINTVLSQTGPLMVFDEGENINTGTHLRGKEVIYEIKFKNSGDEDLKINGVQTSCGCSSALSSSDLIKPGETGSIKFTFNGLGFGKVSKTVTVATNETSTPSHILYLTMNMSDPITLNPQSIITEGKVGDEIKQNATIQNSFDKDIEINEVTSNSPVINVKSDKTHLTSGETATLNISIKIFEESAINAAVIVKTSEGEFQIPVLVDVKAN